MCTSDEYYYIIEQSFELFSKHMNGHGSSTCINQI